MRKALALLLALSLGLAQHQHGAPATPQTSPERSFLSGMIAHHEGALEMVRMALPDLKDPEVRAWAESILKEQDKEIGVMRALLARLGGLDQAAYQAMAREMAAMVARLRGARKPGAGLRGAHAGAPQRGRGDGPRGPP
jgi:predicted outer membrane protein